MADQIEIYHNVCNYDFDHLDFKADYYAKRLQEYLDELYPDYHIEITSSTDTEYLNVEFTESMEWEEQMDFERDLKQEIKEFTDKLIEGDIE